ncbi:MAG: flagellin, partial [Pseudomonadota bacterium]
MTSILNNQGAQVALSTLRQVNNDLLETQTQISTGLRVSNASQDAAVFAVSSVIRSDVSGFQSISESLSLGQATVTVARNASEQITSLLQDAQSR